MVFVAGKARQDSQLDAADIRQLAQDIAAELDTTQADITTINTGLTANGTDRAAIGTATNVQVRDIVSRMLTREDALLKDYRHEKQVKLRWLKALRWLIRIALRW